MHSNLYDFSSTIRNKVQTVEKEGIELVIAIDVSNSMLTEDVSPNRLLEQSIFCRD